MQPSLGCFQKVVLHTKSYPGSLEFWRWYSSLAAVTGIGGQDEKTQPQSGGGDPEALNLQKREQIQKTVMFIATNVASVPALATASAALAAPNCAPSKQLFILAK